MEPRDLLAQLAKGETLSRDHARHVFECLLQGQLEPAQTAALLALLALRTPSIDELVGAALAMRAYVTPVPIDHDDLARRDIALIDTCGTGGAAKTFNVSTLAAIVAAAAAPSRLAVAKHGNRSRTGRGSAELLKGLGVNVDASPASQSLCLRECGICFCFAIHHHPAMKHAGPIRQSLGFPTIFNLLGPLTNPARATHQLMGVYDETMRPRIAAALAQLQARRAWVLRSEDGLDELSLNAPTRITTVQRTAPDHATIHETIIDPAALGLPPAPPTALIATDLPDAVRIARALLAGQPGPRRDMLLLNAAAALVVADAAPTMPAALNAAANAIDSGAAAQTLATLVRLSSR